MPYAQYAIGIIGPILATNSLEAELPEGRAQIEVPEGFQPERWWVDGETGELLEPPQDGSE